ncbi:hypothetical protein [Roseibacillus persicicus]|uniref:hypothetical protein n=1 Tax=Roseibacillus persicicus TaxID=454148 RepID=UPI00280DC441|nr:hypothetical protein [Roseibacillus persicicus]MDQ8188710.1 hypothetical protein [Roseibacillus persicicus]
MKFTSFPHLIGALLISASTLGADELPILTEKPWEGVWVGYEEREFDYAIGGKEGAAKIYLKVKSKGEMERISLFRALDVHFVLEEEIGGKWQKRSVEKDGFETTQAASVDAEKFELIATHKGGTKIKVVHELDGEEIKISTSIVETESKNPLRAGVEVVIPDLYRIREEIEERELKKKLKGDEIRAVGIDGKKFKFDLHDEVNLGDEKVLAKGAAEFSVESKNLAKKTISLSSEVAKTGKILFDQRKSLHEGFKATWYPAETAAGKPVPQLVIEIE